MINFNDLWVIVAHPDDAEISAYSFIESFTEVNDCTCKVVILSNGSKHDPTSVQYDRIQESRLAFEPLKRVHVEFINMQSELYSSNVEPVAAALRKSLIQHTFETTKRLILTHSVCDSHHEHRVVSQAVDTAVRQTKNSILHLDGPSTTIQFQPNFFHIFDIQAFERKLTAIRCHISQLDKAYLSDRTLERSNFNSNAFADDDHYVESFMLRKIIC